MNVRNKEWVWWLLSVNPSTQEAGGGGLQRVWGHPASKTQQKGININNETLQTQNSSYFKAYNLHIYSSLNFLEPQI